MLIISRGNIRPEIQLVQRLYEAGIDLVFIRDPSFLAMDKLVGWKVPTVKMTLHSHFDWAGIKRLRQMIRKEGFDIVHALASRPLSNSIWACYGTDVKLVAFRGVIGHVHRWDPSAWIKYLNPRINRLICLSKAVRDYLLSAGIRRDKLVTIYYGQDPEYDKCNKRVGLDQFGIPPGAFVVGCIANIRRVKGVDVLIRAAHFFPEGSPVHFLLIGELRDPLVKKLANDPKISHRIHFTGFRPDATAIIRECNVAVAPSRMEALNIGIMEAMIQGVPPVVTDVGGLPELVVDKECGFVVPPEDPSALAKAILRLWRDPLLCQTLGLKAKKRILEQFNIERTVRETIALYEDLVASK